MQIFLMVAYAVPIPVHVLQNTGYLATVISENSNKMNC